MTKRRSGIAIAVLLLLLVAWLWTPDKDRDVLESQYASSPSSFIEVAGLRLHLRDTGPRDALVIIMLHGLGASLHTWDRWADALDEDYRVIRFDLPGAGLTGADPTNDYSDERGIEVVVALMDRLGIESATMLGHSMGGRLAWRFAAAMPARVDKLVLVAPDGFESPGFAYDTAPEVPAAMYLMPYVLPKPLLMMALEPAYADPTQISDERKDRYYDLMLAPGIRDAMIHRLRQSVLKNPVPFLRTITTPTLLIWGELDAMIPVANADDYLAAMPDAALVVIKGAGHVPHEEAPLDALEPLRSFLAD